MAQQAAQAAITQALQLAPVSPPITIPMPQLLITLVAVSQPITLSTTCPLQVPLLPPVLSNLADPAPHPSTSGAVQASHQPPATANLTAYNVPGKLLGMIPPNVIQKILSFQFFDLATLLPCNISCLRDTQPIRVQPGSDDRQQLFLARLPASKKQMNIIQEWVTAFALYAAVLTTADPTRGANLFECMRTIIVQAASEFSGDAWQKYDTAFSSASGFMCTYKR